MKYTNLKSFSVCVTGLVILQKRNVKFKKKIFLKNEKLDQSAITVTVHKPFVR